jgi:hypothetical protein
LSTDLSGTFPPNQKRRRIDFLRRFFMGNDSALFVSVADSLQPSV